jgi:hypothetical protein
MQVPRFQSAAYAWAQVREGRYAPGVWTEK